MHTWQSVWEGMTRGQRLDAAETLCEFMHHERPRELVRRTVELLAEAAGEPAHRIEKMEPWKQARLLAELEEPPEILTQNLIVHFHLHRRRRLMRDFLDALGLPHENGVLFRDRHVDPPRPDALDAAVDRVLENHSRDHVELYLDAIEASGKPWRYLSRARTQRARIEAAAAEQAGSAPGRQQPDVLSDLDALVRDAVVASLSGAEGALDSASRRALVGEFVRLGGHRDRSYYHLGLLDALEHRELDASFPERTDRRLGWYLAGALTGLARTERYEEAAALLDEHPSASRALGIAGHPASPLVGRVLFDSLAARQRLAEVPEFMDAVGVFNGGVPLLEALLDAATGLLRDRQPDPAGPLVELCREAARLHEEHVGPLPDGLTLDIRRRQAHFARLKARWDEAEAILDHLLAGGGGDHAGALLADRGLVRCRYRALGDVQLPKRRKDLGRVAQSLSPGEEDFRAAAESGELGGHGEYCLGVLELARGRTEEARPLLDRAVAAMERNPDLYGRLGVLPRARLYLGHCLAATLDRQRVARAGECLLAGLVELPGETPYLIRETLGHVALAAPQHATGLLGELRPMLGGALLDVALEAELLRQLPDLQQDLAARAARKTRAAAERFDDCEALLRAARACGNEELAMAALDGMEELSQGAPEGDRLLGVLDDAEACGTLWTAEEVAFAKLRLYETRGDTGRAAALLQAIAHRVLTEEGVAGAREVGEYLDRIRGYGIEPEPTLVARIEALRAAPAETVAKDAPVRGTVLFIGGNETQQRYDASIREHFQKRHPRVTLLLRHPGWGSNWASVLGRMSRDFDRADAVVLMRFVRTQFGRSVRRICGEKGLRWHACTGHGRESIHAAVEAAIQGLAG